METTWAIRVEGSILVESFGEVPEETAHSARHHLEYSGFPEIVAVADNITEAVMDDLNKHGRVRESRDVWMGILTGCDGELRDRARFEIKVDTDANQRG